MDTLQGASPSDRIFGTPFACIVDIVSLGQLLPASLTTDRISGTYFPLHISISQEFAMKEVIKHWKGIASMTRSIAFMRRNFGAAIFFQQLWWHSQGIGWEERRDRSSISRTQYLDQN